MALFPITGYFAGDFVPFLVAVDTEDTVEIVGEKIASVAVGKRVAPPTTETGYDVLVDDELIDPTASFGDVVSTRGIPPLGWVDVRFRRTADV